MGRDRVNIDIYILVKKTDHRANIEDGKEREQMREFM